MTTQNSTLRTPQQEQFIDFVASGKVDFWGKRTSYEDFANLIKVDRSTLYNWQKSIPDFWDEVGRRSGQYLCRYVPKVLNAMVVKAVQGDVAAAKLVLNQADQLKGAPKPAESPSDYDSLLLGTIDGMTSRRQDDPDYMPIF